MELRHHLTAMCYFLTHKDFFQLVEADAKAGATLPITLIRAAMSFRRHHCSPPQLPSAPFATPAYGTPHSGISRETRPMTATD